MLLSESEFTSKIESRSCFDDKYVTHHG